MPETTKIKEEIEIPNGVEVSIEEKTIHVKGEKGSLSKVLSHPKIDLKVKNNIVEISCSKSFPIKTSVEGNEFVIQNFLGERSPRKAKILENVKVETMGDNVTVSGIDKEKVGQTAANIERATKVKHRDIRVFQDGVYLISKRG